MLNQRGRRQQRIMIWSIGICLVCVAALWAATRQGSLSLRLAHTSAPSAKDLVRATGTIAGGTLMLRPLAKEQITQLGAPSCLGQSTDYAMIGDYEVVFADAEERLEAISRIDHLEIVTREMDKPFTMSPILSKDDNSQWLLLYPRYTDCHAMEFYLFGEESGHVSAYHFQMEELETNHFYDNSASPDLQPRWENSQFIVYGGYGAGQDKIKRYVFEPSPVPSADPLNQKISLMNLVSQSDVLPNGSEMIPELVPLAYTALINTQTVELLESEAIHQVLKETKVLGGTAFFYEKLGDENEVYAGFRSGGQQWGLGPAAGWVYRNQADTVVGESALFGEQLLRYVGAFGSAYVQENYYTIQDGKPVPYLRVDTGMYGLQTDLDDDNIPELVSSRLTNCTIYRLQDNHFLIMDVSEAFGGIPVLWQEGKRFLAQPINGVAHAYEYTAKGFKRLP
ncbi:MAG: hypothetical protein K6T85_02535 [Gorillibacterium sp.]|nr:hypothetical protein [Gorillibacterium sp.]